MLYSSDHAVFSRYTGIVLGLMLVISLGACGRARQSSGSTPSGSTSSAAPPPLPVQGGDDKKPVDSAANQAKQDEMKKPPATSSALTDSEIIAKMNWLPIFDNNRINKFNTGFGGGATFTLAAVVYVDGFIPEEIEKTLRDEDLNRIYTSAEFVDKRYQARAKLSISSDPAFFKMEELPDTELDPKAAIRVYFLTSLKAGTTMIEASYEGKKLAAATTIATYTTAQITDGKARYTTAVAGATPSPSCLSCHGAQGGANHSPTWMAQFSDAALLSTIETGVNSDVNYKTKVAHKMTFAAPAQRDGIVAYLRSLPPAP